MIGGGGEEAASPVCLHDNQHHQAAHAHGKNGTGQAENRMCGICFSIMSDASCVFL